MGTGLLLALLTGAGSWLAGAPLLTSAYLSLEVPVLGEVSLTTSLLLDTAIYLLVTGAAIEVLRLLGVYGAPEVRAPEGRELR
jgi:multisubunit Na+/H+ antiporter MnhB subunit